MGKLLGAYLRKQRKSQNLTILKTAECAGISTSMLTSTEAGQRAPSFAVIARIAVAVGVDDLNRVFHLRYKEMVREALDECSDDARLKQLLEHVSESFETCHDYDSALVEKSHELLNNIKSLNRTATELVELFGLQEDE